MSVPAGDHYSVVLPTPHILLCRDRFNPGFNSEFNAKHEIRLGSRVSLQMIRFVLAHGKFPHDLSQSKEPNRAENNESGSLKPFIHIVNRASNGYDISAC